MVWTKDIEDELLLLSQYSEGYTRMFLDDSQYYSKIYNRVSIFTVLSAIISAGLTSVGVGVGTDNTGYYITSIICGFFTALSESLLRYAEFETKIKELKIMGSQFSSLSNNIRRQLSLTVDEREPAKLYHTWISKTYEDTLQNSQSIRQKTVNRYKKFCKNNNIPFPNERPLTKIEVKEEVKQDDTNTTIKPLSFNDSEMRYQLERLKQTE